VSSTFTSRWRNAWREKHIPKTFPVWKTCHVTLWTDLIWFYSFQMAGKCHNAASIRWNMENLGRDPLNQNFRKFRSTTEWIGSVQKEKFRKIESTFGSGPLFSVGPVRSKLTVPFELIFNPNASLFVTFHRCFSYMCSNNSYKAVFNTQCMFWLLKTVYFLRDFRIFFRYTKVVFEDLWT